MPNSIKTFSLDELKDEFIGPLGSPEREAYEYELSMELLGSAIRQARKARKLTQSELGSLVGVQKAQISKLESSTRNANIATLMTVFQALDARVTFTVHLNDRIQRMRGSTTR